METLPNKNKKILDKLKKICYNIYREVRKMTEKNKRKMEAKKNRVYFAMNTGTRTHSSKKDYKRIKRWEVSE